jgi:hypothetical protein
MTRLKSLWHLLNFPCSEAARLASESLDRDLDRYELIALKSHLVLCLACRRYLRQVLLLRRALRQVVTELETDQDGHGPRLPEDLRARIKQALRER